VIHGTQNMISIYSGSLTLVRRIKFVGQNYTSLVSEGGLSTWEGVVIWGILSGTAPIDRAVYTLGSKSKDYPDALNKDFQTSTKKVSNVISIGAIYGLDAENLFVCWKDSTVALTPVYGIDNIDITKKESAPYVSTLRIDAGYPNLEKVSHAISLRTQSLETTQSVDIYYRLNSNGDFIYLDTMNGEENPGVYYRSFDFSKQWFEVEFKLILNNNGTTAQTVLSFELYYDVQDNIQLGFRVAP
jgi:hypothetical protein